MSKSKAKMKREKKALKQEQSSGVANKNIKEVKKSERVCDLLPIE